MQERVNGSPGRRHGLCKCPVATVGLTCTKSCKEVGSRVSGSRVDGEIRKDEEIRVQVMESLLGHGEGSV